MFTNPITGKKHRSWETLHKSIQKEIRNKAISRAEYEEIAFMGPLRPKKLIDLYRKALEQEYVSFDSKGRGEALNHDLYGYDPSQGVAIIQARQAFRRHKNDYISTHKTYFLVGRNEITGEYFRHPVSAHAVRASILANPDPVHTVKSVQRWMWEVTEKQLEKSIRQGDILLVPEKKIPDVESKGTTLAVAESHVISASEIRLHWGRCYALNPSLVHTKGQHHGVAGAGWYSIRVAREADAWNFAERIGD